MTPFACGLAGAIRPIYFVSPVRTDRRRAAHAHGAIGREKTTASALAVALVALTLLCDRRRLNALVGCQRAADVVTVRNAPFVISATEAFVAHWSYQFPFDRHMLLDLPAIQSFGRFVQAYAGGDNVPG